VIYYATLLVLVISSLINVGLAIYAWRQRHIPGAMAFFVSALLFTIWPVAQAFDLTIYDLQLKILLMKIRIDPPVFGAIAWLVMITQLIGRENLLNWRRLAFLSSIPILNILINLTGFSDAFRYGYYVDSSGAFPILHWANGFWFWIWFVWSYVIFILPFFILFDRKSRNLMQLTRQQIGGLSFGIALPLVVNLLFQAGITPLTGFNFTPASFALSGLILLWFVFQYHLFDVIPVAREFLIDSMNDGVLVLDNRNRVMDSNGAMQKLAGQPGSAMLGRDVETVLKSWREFTFHSNDLTETQTDILINENPPRYLNLRISPIFDKPDHLAGRLVIVRDVTSEKLTEKALETSRNNLRRLLESAPDAMLIVDRNGNIIFANKQSEVMFGYAHNELLAQPIEILLPERLAKTHQVHRTVYYQDPKTRQMGEGTDLELHGCRKDGTGFPVEISLSTLEAESGHVVITAIRDVTERKQIEAARAFAESELQTALKRTNILYEITRTGISSNSLESLLSEAVQKVAQGLPADRAALITIDFAEKKIKNFVRGGRNADQVELSVSYDELMDGLSGWVIQNSKSALSPKGSPDPRESESVQRRRVETNCGAIIVTPLQYQNQILGTLTIINQPQEPDFNQKDVELLEAVSAQIASAIVKVSLEENLQGYNERLTFLHETTLDLLNRRGVDELLQSIIEQASEFLNAPFCEIMLKEGDELVVKAYTRNQQFLEGDRVNRNEAHLSWQAFDTRLPAVVNDYSHWPLRRELYQDLQLSASASIPILAHGMSVGVLEISRTDAWKPFDPSEIHAATLFTQLAALALDNAKLHDSLLQEAIRDPLTGLFNRRFMEETLTKELGRAQRKSHQLCVVMFDLDNLKDINDTLGHDIGDEALSQLGLLLRAKIRASDTACRYGGDEFLIIMPETNMENARQRMEEFRKEVRQIRLINNKETKPITLSVGIAEFPEHGEMGTELLKAADNALYQAKQSGRDTVMLA